AEHAARRPRGGHERADHALSHRLRGGPIERPERLPGDRLDAIPERAGAVELDRGTRPPQALDLSQRLGEPDAMGLELAHVSFSQEVSRGRKTHGTGTLAPRFSGAKPRSSGSRRRTSRPVCARERPHPMMLRPPQGTLTGPRSPPTVARGVHDVTHEAV